MTRSQRIRGWYDSRLSGISLLLKADVSLVEIFKRFECPNSSFSAFYSWIMSTPEVKAPYVHSGRGKKRLVTKNYVLYLKKRSAVGRTLLQGKSIDYISRLIGMEPDTLLYHIGRDRQMSVWYHSMMGDRKAKKRSRFIELLISHDYEISKVALAMNRTTERMRQLVKEYKLELYVKEGRETARKKSIELRRLFLLSVLYKCNFDRKKAAEMIGVTYLKFMNRCYSAGIKRSSRGRPKTLAEDSVKRLGEELQSRFGVTVSVSELIDAVVAVTYDEVDIRKIANELHNRRRAREEEELNVRPTQSN